MSGDLWTADQVKELVERLLADAERLECERVSRVEASIAALSEKLEAIRVAQVREQEKFEHGVERSFTQVNEFRGALDDLSKAMATRRELESQSGALNGKIDDLAVAVAELRSRIDVGPVALQQLQSHADVQRGRQAGIGLSGNVIATLLGAMVAVAGLVIAVYLATNN